MELHDLLRQTSDAKTKELMRQAYALGQRNEANRDKDTTDNEGHKESEQAIAKGDFSLVSDETSAGGRFQVIAGIQGGVVILNQWHQPVPGGDWHSTKSLWLAQGGVPKITALLRKFGYDESGNKIAG